ncbi:MAG: hypothetical protein M3O02_10395, partial [Acidobacteriota bacterium]|nr:hypothetical protein [Acidobacteriota bacterium]
MRNPVQLLHALRRSLRTRGLMGTARAVRRRLFPRWVPVHPFDRTHGTDTGGLLPTSAGPHPSAAHSRDYWGTAPSLLQGSLARWQATLADTPYLPSDYTFLDLGCGKGRALMLASELPFARILGVELDPALVAIARRNLALWARTPHPATILQVLHADALLVPLPETPLLLYLFNPFGEPIVRALADRLAALLPARRHPVDILYTRPEHILP